jgi:hypothetical protein
VVVRVLLGAVVKKEISARAGNRTVIDQSASHNFSSSYGVVGVTSNRKYLCVIILHFCEIYGYFFLKKNRKAATSKVSGFSDISPKRHGCDSKPVCVVFVADNVAQGQFMRVFLCSPVSINPPVHHTYI